MLSGVHIKVLSNWMTENRSFYEIRTQYGRAALFIDKILENFCIIPQHINWQWLNEYTSCVQHLKKTMIISIPRTFQSCFLLVRHGNQILRYSIRLPLTANPFLKINGLYMAPRLYNLFQILILKLELRTPRMCST